MEQRELPGFPVNEVRVEKERRRRQAKGLEAVLILSRCLETALGGDHAHVDLAEQAGKRRRGRPREKEPARVKDRIDSNESEKSQPTETTTDPVAPPAETDEPELAGGPPPAAVPEPDLPQIPEQLNMDVLFERFHQERLVPDPGYITTSKAVTAAFGQWFREKYPDAPWVPDYNPVGRQMVKRYSRKKVGTVRYFGVRVVEPLDLAGPRDLFSN